MLGHPDLVSLQRAVGGFGREMTISSGLGPPPFPLPPLLPVPGAGGLLGTPRPSRKRTARSRGGVAPPTGWIWQVLSPARQQPAGHSYAPGKSVLAAPKIDVEVITSPLPLPKSHQVLHTKPSREPQASEDTDRAAGSARSKGSEPAGGAAGPVLPPEAGALSPGTTAW